MKSFLISYAGTLILSFIALKYLHYEQEMLSFFVGAILALLNVAVLYFSWKRMLLKKNLVLPASVIVFKYPILGFILYEVVHLKQIHLSWFLIGMGAFIPPAILTFAWWSLENRKGPASEISLKIE